MIEMIAISSGTSPATIAPKTRIRMIERGRNAELELAGLQIVLRELVEVVVDRRIACHRDGERGVPVSALGDVLDRACVVACRG